MTEEESKRRSDPAGAGDRSVRRGAGGDRERLERLLERTREAARRGRARGGGSSRTQRTQPAS